MRQALPANRRVNLLALGNQLRGRQFDAAFGEAVADFWLVIFHSVIAALIPSTILSVSAAARRSCGTASKWSMSVSSINRTASHCSLVICSAIKRHCIGHD